jgi:hypothetical protein
MKNRGPLTADETANAVNVFLSTVPFRPVFNSTHIGFMLEKIWTPSQTFVPDSSLVCSAFPS